jgi:hypothetical protein
MTFIRPPGKKRLQRGARYFGILLPYVFVSRKIQERFVLGLGTADVNSSRGVIIDGGDNCTLCNQI